MPHRCVKCNKIYGENSSELANGCSCGSRVFVFVKPGGEIAGDEDISWIARELAGTLEKPKGVVALEVENIRMLSKGIFEVDISSLMSKNPVVVKDGNGVYYIRLSG
ncbi:MAG: Zn-ribbon containing protein [Candidatus Micrarchaeia archaeon]